MTMPGLAKMTWMPQSSSVVSEPAVPAVVDEHQRQADHDRRHRQRQVDQRREDPLAGERVADQQQRHADTEDEVDEDRVHRDLDGQLQRVTTSGSGSASRSAARPSAKVCWTTYDRPGDQHHDVADGEQRGAAT